MKRVRDMNLRFTSKLFVKVLLTVGNRFLTINKANIALFCASVSHYLIFDFKLISIILRLLFGFEIKFASINFYFRGYFKASLIPIHLNMHKVDAGYFSERCAFFGVYQLIRFIAIALGSDKITV